MTCRAYRPPRQPTLSSARPSRPPVGETTLVLEPGVEPIITARCDDCDAKTALARGLAEYAGSLSAQSQGRPVRFRKVFEAWPQSEERVEFPSAVVLMPMPGEYVSRGLSPVISAADQFGEPDGRYLVCQSEMNIEARLAIWTDDPPSRAALSKMLEDAFAPVDWMAGFQLDLPHYYGARSVWEMKSSSIEDSEENAARRHRIAAFVLRGRVPVLRIASPPEFKPRAEVGVT